MQSEKFDSKVKEAAEHHHPAYDEKAWTGMEKLLDKHLPQKKDGRKRIILFLMFFLMLGGAALIMLFNKSQQNKPAIVNEQNPSQQNSLIKQKDITNIPKTDQTLIPVVSGNSNSNYEQEKIVPESRVLENQLAIPKQPDHKKIIISDNTNTYKTKSKAGNEPAIIVTEQSSPSVNNSDKNNLEKLPVSETDFKTKNEINNKSELPNDIAENKVSLQKNELPEPIIEMKDELGQKTDSSLTKNISDNKRKSQVQVKKRNSFFVTMSAAPNVSAAGNNKAGKLKLDKGVGIGYSIRDKFTIRTGFYSGQKIYSASPDVYHPPAMFWAYYPNLVNVDADCKVYEIPLLISYNFGNSLKQSWFGTAGLTSYLMKRETYQYTYKDNAGQYRSASRTIYDDNKHYFSVLTLSAGYQRKINNTFFISAEPYMKIPLTGVGYGKVKLYNAGILFSVGAKLFETGKKTNR